MFAAAPADHVSKPPAGKGLESFGLLPAGSGSTRRLRMERFACLLLLGFSSLASGHEDTMLRWDADGTLHGLPESYGPSRLDVTFAPLSDVPVRSIRLSIGKHQSAVPECITELLDARSAEQVSVVASWYHDLSLLPPYLISRFEEAGHATKRASLSYSLMFNLSTATLHSATIVVPRQDGSLQHLPIDLSALCPGARP